MSRVREREKIITRATNRTSEYVFTCKRKDFQSVVHTRVVGVYYFSTLLSNDAESIYSEHTKWA